MSGAITTQGCKQCGGYAQINFTLFPSHICIYERQSTLTLILTWSHDVWIDKGQSSLGRLRRLLALLKVSKLVKEVALKWWITRVKRAEVEGKWERQAELKAALITTLT